MLLFILVPTAYAINDTEIKAGLTPDSPFYFLDRWQENIVETFTSKEKLAEFNLERAAERSAELQEIEDNEEIDDLNRDFEERIKKAELEDQLDNEVKEQVKELRKRNAERLREVLERVPDEAKDAIEHAIRNQEKNEPTDLVQSYSRVLDIPDELNLGNDFEGDKFKVEFDDKTYYYQIQGNGVYELTFPEEVDYNIKVKDKDALEQELHNYEDSKELNLSRLESAFDLPLSLKTKLIKEFGLEALS